MSRLELATWLSIVVLVAGSLAVFAWFLWDLWTEVRRTGEGKPE